MPGQITNGLAFGPDIDPDRADRDLRAPGRSLLFLNKSPVFACDWSVYGTAVDGSLLASLADDGRISARTQADEPKETLASIDAAAVQPGRVLMTDPTGCQVIDERSDRA